MKLASEKNEPVALIIGSNPYRRQVEDYLVGIGLLTAKDETALSEREQALEILNQDENSNLGWRILLAVGDRIVASNFVRAAAETGVPLSEVIPGEDRGTVLKEAEEWAARRASEKVKGDEAATVPSIKVTSFEGAKGLAAQYVFLIGLHSGDMPRNAADVEDIEICRFLVGLTRTKKKCAILVTKRFGEHFKRRSEFLSWIDAGRFEEKRIDAAYWKK